MSRYTKLQREVDQLLASTETDWNKVDSLIGEVVFEEDRLYEVMRAQDAKAAREAKLVPLPRDPTHVSSGGGFGTVRGLGICIAGLSLTVGSILLGDPDPAALVTGAAMMGLPAFVIQND